MSRERILDSLLGFLLGALVVGAGQRFARPECFSSSHLLPTAVAVTTLALSLLWRWWGGPDRI